MKLPKIKLEKNKIDLLIEILTFSLIIISITIIGVFYNQLPEKIPIHFNWPTKDINGLGSKNIIFASPILFSIIAFGIYKLNKFPWIFNYPFEINEKNAVYNYTQATLMLRILNLFIGVICFYFTLTSVLGGLGNKLNFFNKIELFFPFIFIGIPVVFLIQILAKNKTSNN